MQESPHIIIEEEPLYLHGKKAIYWYATEMLLIADVHLGKAAHFNKHGLRVPKGVATQNLRDLAILLEDFSPKRVLFLGDLFHSRYNQEWEDFCEFLRDYPSISFELVMGNHDILQPEVYANSPLTLHEEPYLVSPFMLSHHPMEEVPKGWYNLYGHIHPCVHLEGKGKQFMRLPCFYFGNNQGILPAFGAFTGLAKIEVGKLDRVFVIAEETVMEVQ